MLVCVKYNLQLEIRPKSREEKEKTYDHICLSDIELDDEWITKTKNHCFPIDSSWMDVHECFDVKKGATSKKGRDVRT